MLTLGLSRAGFVLLSFVLDKTTLGLLLLLRSHARVEAALFVLDLLHLGLPTLLRSHAHLGFVLFMLDMIHVGSLMFLQSPTHLGFTVLVTGLSRVGFVSFLLVIDTTFVGSLSLLHSFSCPELAMSAFDFAHLASSPFVRTHGRSGFSVSCLGMARLGALILVFDSNNFEFLFFLRSLGRLGFPLLTSDFTHLDLFPSIQGFACLESSCSVLGLTRLSFVSLLLIIDDSPLGFSVLARSFAQPESLTLMPNFAEPDSSASLRSSANLGLSLLVFSVAKLGSSALVVDYGDFELLIPVRSFSCTGLPLLVFNFADLDFSVLSRSLVCLELTALLTGLTRIGLVFLLFVTDTCKLGSSALAQSSSRLDLVSSMFDFSDVDSLLLSRGSARMSSASSVFGIARMGLPALMTRCCSSGFFIFAAEPRPYELVSASI